MLVTGAGGFIGRHLVRHLQDEGWDARALTRTSGFDLMHHDLPLEGVCVVVHAAARTYVPDAWSDPVDFHRINGHGTVRVLEQCRRHGVAVVYVSAYVYGVPERLPISESAPVRVNNPYGFSKFMGEEACRFYADTFSLPVNVFRLFNVYGPGQDAHFLIPTIVDQIRDPSVPEIVVADLGPRRDYVHIADVAAALRVGVERREPGLFNVGSGVSLSVEEIIRTALDAAGSAKPFRDRGERRPHEVMDVVADVTALQATGRWRPGVGFAEGMRTVWEFATL